MENEARDTNELREKSYNATILGERIHHGAVMVIRVKPDRPVPEPKPGQWLDLGLGVWEPVMEGAEAGSAKRMPSDGIIRRAYSISCPILSPDRRRLHQQRDGDGFEFFLSLVVPPAERARRVPNLTGRLFCLKPGDRLFLSDEPTGDYTLDPVGPGDNVLFVATGTGEAPHNLMIWDLLHRQHPGQIASVVSVRHREDLAYDAVHRRLAEIFPRYRYTAITTRDPESDGRHLQDLLLDGTIGREAGFPLDPARTQVYLCGNPEMIGPPRLITGTRSYPEPAGLVELLETRLGFNADVRGETVNVHYERYW